MAEPTELDNKRAADRRLALLALVGDQPEQTDGCPAAEELAALVEGQLAAEQRRQCLAHLAACEHCYTLWQRLHRLHQEQSAQQPRHGLIRLLSRPKVLTATGSLLAAAASLAVFLTLTARVDRAPLLPLNQPALQEQDLQRSEGRSIPAPAPAAPPAETPADEVRSRPAPAPPAAEPASRTPAEPRPGRGREKMAQEMIRPAAPTPDAARKDEPARRDATALRSKAETGQAAESLPEKKRRQEEVFETESLVGADSAPPAASVAKVVHPGQWQERLLRGCSKGAKPAFFTAMEQEGKGLLRENRLSKEERERIERILSVLGKKQPAEDCCRELREIIGPAAGR